MADTFFNAQIAFDTIFEEEKFLEDFLQDYLAEAGISAPVWPEAAAALTDLQAAVLLIRQAHTKLLPAFNQYNDQEARMDRGE